LDLTGRLGLPIVGLEGLADLRAGVAEVQDVDPVLSQVGAVSRDRVCTALTPTSFLSTYMPHSLGWSKPVWYFSATIRTP
jgi:hypothetical protein